jgi:cyclopropane-fatty-acyl-phospholipid synthase
MAVRPVASAVAAQEAVIATNKHYELPPEFFAAFLDRHLKYSCGLYPRDGMSVDEAQTEKLRFIARHIGAQAGRRVLDIGCGWGSLTLFLAAEYGCQVTGITPSRTQANFIADLTSRQGLGDRIHLTVGTFPGVSCDSGYDAVTMVGSVNHMPDQRAVLARVGGLLRRDGRLYLSESCFSSTEKYAEFADSPAARQVAEDIFGYADMVPLSGLIRVVESAGLSITGVTDLTGNFHRTVADWTRRAQDSREAIERAVPGMFEPLMRYLYTTNVAWGYTSKHYALTALKSRLGPREVS